MKKLSFIIAIVISFLMGACHPRNSGQRATGTTKETNPQNDTTARQMQPVSDEQYRKWNDMLASGTDFIASGNEPFWALQMNLDSTILFRLAGGDSVEAPAVKAIRLMDVAASSYRVQTQKGLLNIVIYDRSCVNDMSGDTLPKTVEVSLDDKRYAGCGRFLADYRLHDIWVLRAINDTAVNPKSLSKGSPFLEINLTEQRIGGHSGCNTFGGPLDVKGKHISFPRITGTLMACPDGGFESRYFSLLSVKEMPYKIDNGSLMIFSGNSTLRYQKTD